MSINNVDNIKMKKIILSILYPCYSIPGFNKDINLYITTETNNINIYNIYINDWYFNEIDTLFRDNNNNFDMYYIVNNAYINKTKGYVIFECIYSLENTVPENKKKYTDIDITENETIEYNNDGKHFYFRLYRNCGDCSKEFINLNGFGYKKDKNDTKSPCFLLRYLDSIQLDLECYDNNIKQYITNTIINYKVNDIDLYYNYNSNYVKYYNKYILSIQNKAKGISNHPIYYINNYDIIKDDASYEKFLIMIEKVEDCKDLFCDKEYLNNFNKFDNKDVVDYKTHSDVIYTYTRDSTINTEMDKAYKFNTKLSQYFEDIKQHIRTSINILNKSPKYNTFLDTFKDEFYVYRIDSNNGFIDKKIILEYKINDIIMFPSFLSTTPDKFNLYDTWTRYYSPISNLLKIKLSKEKQNNWLFFGYCTKGNEILLKNNLSFRVLNNDIEKIFIPNKDNNLLSVHINVIELEILDNSDIPIKLDDIVISLTDESPKDIGAEPIKEASYVDNIYYQKYLKYKSKYINEKNN